MWRAADAIAETRRCVKGRFWMPHRQNALCASHAAPFADQKIPVYPEPNISTQSKKRKRKEEKGSRSDSLLWFRWSSRGLLLRRRSGSMRDRRTIGKRIFFEKDSTGNKTRLAELFAFASTSLEGFLW